MYVHGPGEPRPKLPFSCSGDMYTLAWCSRVLLPKPKMGADSRVDCLPTWLGLGLGLGLATPGLGLGLRLGLPHGLLQRVCARSG